jgi:hypothetical protein
MIITQTAGHFNIYVLGSRREDKRLLRDSKHSPSTDLLLVNVLCEPWNIHRGYWENCLSQQLFKVFIYIYILPLHVSALAGHLQAEHAKF